MTQPPNDPASGGEPEDWPQGPPQGPGRPGPYGGEQPYGGRQPYGGQQPYGEQPYGEQPYGERPAGEQPYGQQPGYGGLPKYPGQSGYGDEPGYGAPAGYGGAGGYGDPSQGLASRWARLGAAIVDIVLVGIVTSLISLPFVDWGNVFDDSTRGSVYSSNAQLSSNAIGVVLGFFYYWLMHARWGQTLGKKLLGIRVVREDNGQAITTGQAAGRSAFYSVLGGICGCIGLINVAWILWDPRKQALHCKAARTVVVKASPNAPDPYAQR